MTGLVFIHYLSFWSLHTAIQSSGIFCLVTVFSLHFLVVRITAGALPRGLHILNLSKNNISTIEGLRELTRLRVLDLSYNRIVRIGHGMAFAQVQLGDF